MKVLNKIKHFFRNRDYDVYCPYCTSCGETGCCSPTGCINHKKGFYCETNQGALKVSYWTLNEFWEQLDGEKYPEVEKLLDQIYERNYSERRGYIMSLPKKLTIKDKLKNFFYESK